jgi:hypothetical protein
MATYSEEDGFAGVNYMTIYASVERIAKAIDLYIEGNAGYDIQLGKQPDLEKIKEELLTMEHVVYRRLADDDLVFIYAIVKL